MAPSAMSRGNNWTKSLSDAQPVAVLAGRPRQAPPRARPHRRRDLRPAGRRRRLQRTVERAHRQGARPAAGTSVLLEGREVGWAASGRNGGFCAASLTHGLPNGLTRWPGEIHQLEELGARNLDEIETAVARHSLDCDFERTGEIDVATETYQACGTARLVRGAAGQGPRGRRRVPGPRSGTGTGRLPDLPGGPVGPPGRGHAQPGQAGLGPEAGLPRPRGARLRAHPGPHPEAVRRRHGRPHARTARSAPARSRSAPTSSRTWSSGSAPTPCRSTTTP